MKVGVALTDVLTGMYAATAVLAALAAPRAERPRAARRPRAPRRPGGDAREPGGELPRHRPRAGAARERAPQHRAVPGVPTQDGHLVRRGGERRPVRAARARWSGGPSSRATRASRRTPRASRTAASSSRSSRPLLAARPTRRLGRARSSAAGVPCGPINDLAQVFDDPQVRHRGLRVEVPAPARRAGAGRRLAHPALPARRCDTGPPPRLGEHTREVLVEVLGMEDAEVEALRRAE